MIEIETEDGVIVLTQREYDQALADSRHCRCGDCLVCAVREYEEDH